MLKQLRHRWGILVGCGLVTGAFGRTISAAAALAMCLMPAFAPDARAAESKWYAGVSIPLMFIDDTETGTGGTSSPQAVHSGHGERRHGA